MMTPSPTSMQAPFELIETMLHCGRIRFVEDHMARLARAAAHFEIELPLSAIRNELEGLRSTLPARTRYKVRLTVRRHDDYTITAAPVTPGHRIPGRLCYSPYRIDATDPYYYHKTSRRSLYEAEYARAVKAGYHEILFFNEDGALTEGSRSNVIVRISGRYYTPPVPCGVLPGVYRYQLLKRCTQLKEQVLFLDELLEAERIYICNAVRGLQRMVCPPSPLNLPTDLPTHETTPPSKHP